MKFTGTYLNNDNRYLYNSKEFEDNFELEWYDYGARFYDPALGRWHTPDLQAESNSSWSPYTYCLNDPLVYIDPSGELALFAFVTDYLATLFLKGGLSFNKNVRQSAWKKFDPTAPWSKTNQAFKIDYGLIRNEFTEWFHWQKGGTAWEYIQEFFSKVYPTEVIQSTMGYVYASTKIMRGKVDKIGYYEYRTTLRIKEGGLWLASGVSLGHYILGEGMALNPDDVGYDVKLLAYEFGHTYQSRIAGVLYLPKYGFPSAIWGYGSPAEKDADYRAYAKFGIWPHGKYNKGQPNRIKWWEYRYAPVIWPFMWLWN
jgi:RHS repeat-associated protein